MGTAPAKRPRRRAGGFRTIRDIDACRDIDSLPAGACAAALAPLFEGAPRFLARLCAARPFGDPDTLFARARSIAHALSEPEQVELIDAHPRLGAPPASVSALSFREQGYDRGPGHMAPANAAPVASADQAPVPSADQAPVETAPVASADPALPAALERLNVAYEARFGFRYCVFVAGRPLAGLLPDFEAALGAERPAELRRAIAAVVDIAEDRWRRVPGAGPGPPPRTASDS